MKGFTPIVKFLAENGADLYARDANGSTALDLAEGNYNEPFLRQAAEPHADTAAVLKELMAARPPTATQTSATAASR
jgi:ankyrin repeat protein